MNIANPINLATRYPNATLMILIAALGGIADFLYAYYSSMGQVVLYMSPGEIVRGSAFIVLFIMLLIGKLAIPGKFIFAFMFFFLIAIIYMYLGEVQIFSRQEMRIFLVVKMFYVVLMTSLVVRVIKNKEISIGVLINILILWAFVFFIVPIILSYMGIIGYSDYGYRVQHHGMVFSINASTIALLSTYPLIVIPSTAIGVFTSLTGFAACELIGTKAAAVGGVIIPLLLICFALYHRATFYFKTTIFILVLFIVIFIFRDVILGVQYANIDRYIASYYQSSFLSMLTTGRIEYYYQLPVFIEQNNLLELMFGSPILCFNEMDHLMILSRFGLIGMSFYFIVVGRAFIIALRLLRKGWLESQIAIAVFALIAHSIMGGHVISSTIASFPIAVIAALAIIFSNCQTLTDGKRNRIA